MKLANKSGGLIVLPDGTEVQHGDSVEVSSDIASTSGVEALIEIGALIGEKAADKAKK